MDHAELDTCMDARFMIRAVHRLTQCTQLIVQVTINMKTLSVGDVTGEDCVLGFETRQYQVT